MMRHSPCLTDPAGVFMGKAVLEWGKPDPSDPQAWAQALGPALSFENLEEFFLTSSASPVPHHYPQSSRFPVRKLGGVPGTPSSLIISDPASGPIGIKSVIIQQVLE